MEFTISPKYFLLISLVHIASGFIPPDIIRRFEYKISFKGPHLVFKDGTIPFWEHGGSAIASNDQIRITPSIRSQKGHIWSKNTIASSDWEIEVSMRVNGRGRVGADGMAIWYTDKIGTEGPVFGSSDNWNGLGIFLDSFDNDGQQNNPFILIMTNDGTKSYDHHRDGITQQLGGCLRDFRNKPFPIRIKVEYYKRVLTVYYHGGLSNDLSHYEICARVENVDLPKNGHFGVSAATGGLADDHDVLQFLTHSLIDRTAPDTNTPSTEEQKKYDKEYEEFLKQLELEKEKYNREHPEKVELEIDDKKMFEGESDRQFRTILDVQNSIHQSMRSLDSKIAEILGRQERMFSLLSSNANQPQPAAQQQQQQQIPNQVLPQIDTFKRDEVNHLLNQQAEVVRTIRDIYASVSDVHRKTNMLHETARVQQQQQQQPIASQAQANQIDPGMIQQISEGVKSFRNEMTSILSRNQPRCPEQQACLSTFYFLTIIIGQSLLFLIYFVVKSRSDSQLKKFY